MADSLLHTPLYDWHAAHDGRLVDFAGWAMPVQYSSIVAEHVATRSAAGLFDISHMGRLLIGGPDAQALLERTVTRRVADMLPGQIRYALVTNDAGGILDDVLVYRLQLGLSFDWMLVVNAGNREKIVRWLERHRYGQQQLLDATTALAMIAIQGPRALELVSALCGDVPRSLKYYHSAGLPKSSVQGSSSPASSTMPAELARALAETYGTTRGQILVSRTGYTGEDGFELIVGADDAGEIWQRLLDAGRPLGVQPAGLGAQDTLRLEAAMPLYGHELSEQIDPYQAGLAFAVDLEGGKFTGREALAALRDRSDRPVRVGLELAGRRVAREGYPISAGGSVVGQVTSGTFAPTLERPIAMGYVQPAHAAPGTALEIDLRGRIEPAHVVPLPFYRRPVSVVSIEIAREHIVTPSASAAEKLLFAKTHEWVRLEDGPGGKVAVLGVSAFAVEALTDLVYIELPKVGRKLKAGEAFGEIESVKAVSDLYSPVDGEVIAVNEPLVGNLNPLHDDPYGQGWIAKVRLAEGAGVAHLMDHKAYEQQCAEESH